VHLCSGPDPVGIGLPIWGYRPQAPRILQDGDVIRAEVFCNVGMRSTQHQATVAKGEVPNDFERAAVVARGSYDAGVQALRPGRTFSDVVEEMRKPLLAADCEPVYPLIHTLNPIHAMAAGPC